jgi:predicted SprT family Zn-dependent metalloprotease
MNLTDVHSLATELMLQHKLPREWSFAFDRSKVRFGKCDYRHQQISLSRHLVEANGIEAVRETILHEIAHALAPRGAGHGPVWRALAQSIGCNGARCYGSEVARPKPKFRGTCGRCGRVIYRHRRTSIACGKCTAVFDPKFAFIWSHDRGP